MRVMVACACKRVDQAEMQWGLGARPHHDKPWNLGTCARKLMVARRRGSLLK
jgi:hypothetical protein